MSLRGPVRLSSQVFLEAPQTSSLPFLYQTRTLLSRQRAGRHRPVYKCTDRLHSRSSSTAPVRASYKPLEPVADFDRQGGKEPNAFTPRWSAAPSRDVPSRLKRIQWPSETEGKLRDLQRPEKSSEVPVESRQSSRVEEGEAQSSTITASEKAVFDRIYREISTTASERNEARLREGDEQEFLDLDTIVDEDVWDDPREQLNSIFNLAISKSKKHRERLALKDQYEGSAESESHSYKRAIDLFSDDLGRATFEQKELVKRSQLEQPLSAVDEENQASLERASNDHKASVRQSQLEQPLLVTDEEVQASFERAGNDHKAFVDSLLKAANTDVEIWAVLEKEVFNLMAQLNTQTKLEEKARKADLRRQKKAAKSALDYHQDRNKPAASPESAPLPATKKRVSPGSSELDSEALPTSALLSLLQSNYAHHCLHALRLFRDLRLSSPYALHLLSHIKSLGPVSYALGASTELYNEILFQKWIQFSDVQGMADLMEEMINQGIGADVTTLEFLRFVDRSRRLDIQGQHGSAKRTWWELRPIREGWTRVKALYQRFINEMGEAGEWDRERMRSDRKTFRRGRAGEHEWVKDQRGKDKLHRESVTDDEPRAFRKLVLDAPLVKRFSSDWKGSEPVAARFRSPTRSPMPLRTRTVDQEPQRPTRLPFSKDHINGQESDAPTGPKVKLRASSTLQDWE